MPRSSLLAVLVLGTCALFEPVWSQAFSPPISGVLPAGYWGILATDVDGSGLPDLLGYGFNGADYFPDPGGGGPGTFALGTPVPFYRPSIFPTPVTASILEHLDVDGDGDLDLIFAYTLFGSPTSWFWYPGMPGGSLGAPVPLFTTTIGPGPMAIGDLDGDGQWDLVIVSQVLGTSWPAVVEFWLNRPGSWVLALSEPASQSVPRIGDYDQDGDADTVFAGPPSTMYAPRLVSGDPSGTLGPSTSLAATAGIWGSLGIADLDADGYPDIVATNTLNAPPAYPLSGLWALRGDPNAVLVPGPTLNLSIPAGTGFLGGALLGDVDVDGQVDLLTVFSGQVVGPGSPVLTSLQRGDGAGNLSAPFLVSSNPQIFAHILADFDGDGDPDLLRWTAPSGNPSFAYAENRSLYGQGCSGSAGVPIFVLGPATPGNLGFTLALHGALPAAPTVLGLSTGSVVGPACSVLIATAPGALLALLPATADAGGTARIPIALPASLAPLTPITVHGQWAAQDFLGVPVGNTAIALSAGRAITIF